MLDPILDKKLTMCADKAQAKCDDLAQALAEHLVAKTTFQALPTKENESKVQMTLRSFENQRTKCDLALAEILAISDEIEDPAAAQMIRAMFTQMYKAHNMHLESFL